jgi:transcriptional regulator with XRE-family HTH domain
VKRKTVKKYFRDEILLTSIGLKIRQIREKKGISQEMLANECEMDYSQLHRMEMGKVNFSVSYLAKVSKALKVDPKDLLP